MSGGVPDDGAGLDRADLDQPGEDVRERQEEQGRAVAVEEPAEQAHAVADLGQKLRWVSTQPLGRPVVPEV